MQAHLVTGEGRGRGRGDGAGEGGSGMDGRKREKRKEGIDGGCERVRDRDYSIKAEENEVNGSQVL